MATCYLDAAHSCAAARAGLSKLSPLPKLMAEPGEIEPKPLSGFQHPFLDGFQGVARLAQLAFFALQDLIEQITEESSRPDQIILLLPHPYCRPELEVQSLGQQGGISELFCKALKGLLSAHPETKELDAQIEVVLGEPAEFAFVLKMAHNYIKEGEDRTCIVGAVDSLLGERTIEYLLSCGHILTPESSTGYLPGEAAVVLLVSAEPVSRSVGGVKAAAYLQEEYEYHDGNNAGQTEDEESAEDNPAQTAPTFFHGRQYAAAIDSALTKAGLDENNWDLSLGYNEFPADTDRAVEWGNCLLHLKAERGYIDHIQWQNPQIAFGGLGVASLAVAMAMGLHSFARAYADNSHLIATAASASGGRAAIVVQAS